jgi:hypothetical protein
MGRNDQTVRAFRVLFALIEHIRHGLSIEALEQVTKVSRRTLYRDLECLREVGFELVSEKSPSGTAVWRLVSTDPVYTRFTSQFLKHDNATDSSDS